LVVAVEFITELLHKELTVVQAVEAVDYTILPLLVLELLVKEITVVLALMQLEVEVEQVALVATLVSLIQFNKQV
jgi:hypothetical protein